MASNLPTALKSADIGRFALRAVQLESAKPIIAYWCNFWIINQIIEKGLHTSDDEVKLYTVNLMEKLEQFKKENPDNDAVLDSVAANAYVEQFGFEVFSRAEAAMTANKVTKQTADTFAAAATFLELCQIWNPPEAELAAKIKFAKYHTVRIIKAIKAGEDPNISNPVVQEAGLEELEPDNPTADSVVTPGPEQSKQPFIEEVPDESNRPNQTSMSSAPPLVLPETPGTLSDTRADAHGFVSPSNAPQMDIDDESPLSLPSAPADFALPKPHPSLPDTPKSIGGVRHSPPQPPQRGNGAFQSFPPPSGIPPSTTPTASHDPNAFYNTPSGGSASTPAHHQHAPPPPSHFSQAPSAAHVPIAPIQPHHSGAPIPTPPPPAASLMASTTSSHNIPSHGVDDRAITLAQKHARWAVSALAFDDVNTAIKELRNSLKYLGAE